MGMPLFLFFLVTLGSLAGLYFDLSHALFSTALLFCLVLLLIIRRRYLYFACLSIFMLVLSALSAFHAQKFFVHEINRAPQGLSVFHGYLEELSTSLDAKKTGIFAVQYFLDGKKLVPTNLRLSIVMEGGASTLPFKEGLRLRVRGQFKKFQPALSPGMFDAALFGLARNIHGTIIVRSSRNVLIWDDQPQFNFFLSFRQKIRDSLTAMLLPREAAIVLAQLLGDTRLFDYEQKQLYQQIGAGHLLAVSGLQVSLCGFFLFKLFHIIFLFFPIIGVRSYAQRCAAICAIIWIWLFVLLCSAPPSAIRAGLMASTLLLAFCFARQVSIFNTIGLSGLISVLCWPMCVVDPSFLLSYAAVIGMGVFSIGREDQFSGERVENEINPQEGRRRYVLLVIAASLCAGLMTLPLTACLFGELSLAGLFANILLVPIASLLQVPALVSAIVAVCFQWQWAAQLSAFLIALLEALCEGLAKISFGPLLINSINVPITILLLLSIFSSLCFFARKNYFFGTLSSLLGMAFICVPMLWENRGLRITVLAVGQGDSSIFELASGEIILIDGGGIAGSSVNPGTTVVLPALARRGIKKIDIMIVSHPDPDHILGLFPVLATLSVKELWYSGYYQHSLMKKLLSEAKKKDVILKDARYLLGKHIFGQTTVEVLAPSPENKDLIYGELGTNDNSLVIKFSYGVNSALWSGDIEKWGEYYLLSNHPNLQADIVKAPHHGSKTSSSIEFVNSVRAQHIIFCTGANNRWHFPHSQVVERWQNAGAISWDTAKNGQITLWLTGTEVKIKPFR